MAGVPEERNGVYTEVVGDSEDNKDSYSKANERSFQGVQREEITLYTILNRLILAIFFPDSDGCSPLLQRIKVALFDNIPLLRVATENTAKRILLWARRGSIFRALLVVSVGTIALLALTGFVVLMFFFVAATINAIVIALFVSLAAVGGSLAIFFALLTAIYIGALSVAVFVISATTISAIIAAVIATGWIGFFCIIWLATQKGFGLAKNSLNMTGSMVSAYSSARFARSHHGSNK